MHLCEDQNPPSELQVADRRCCDARAYEPSWSTVFNQRFRNRPARSIAARNSLNPISARTKSVIRTLASHQGDSGISSSDSHEVEDVDIFRQPLDPRFRGMGNILLHEPAQANLGSGFCRAPARICASVRSFF